MNISNIHFHDTQILRVIEENETDTLIMNVDYPVNWEHNIFEHRKIVFYDAYNYQVHEMPFSGIPTIIEINILGTTNRWTHLRIQTNSGFRNVSCVSVRLISDSYDTQHTSA